MTVGLVCARTRPLHELEATWKAEGRVPRRFGELVSEPCLCGGVITAHNTDPAIASAVHVHNESPAHAQWAIREGWRHG